MQEKAISLFELTSFIRETIDNQQIRTWVVGEVSEANGSSVGHVYLELVEKSSTNDQPIAKLRCNIWSKTAQKILPKFESETGMRLAPGIKVMVFVTVSFHDVYGLSATVLDIDSSFTLGDIEIQKRETLMRLTADGVIDMNKQIALPTVIQNVAVISAKNAAGFGDFCNQIRHNDFGYGINLTLFSSLMQGAEAERSIVAALERIAFSQKQFDVVVIIRGGGSRSDLACFDGYELASNIAQFPLPIITGIGHERDNSIADVVANTRMKTPTAVAEFIVGRNRDFEAKLNDAQVVMQRIFRSLTNECDARIRQTRTKLVSLSSAMVDREKAELMSFERILQLHAKNRFLIENNRLKERYLALKKNAFLAVDKQKEKLTSLERHIDAVNPSEVLKRGFTLTYVNGRKLSDNQNVKSGDKMRTITKNGSIDSTVD